MKKVFGTILLAAVILMSASKLFAEDVQPISASDLESKIQNNTNKALIVDFFATWCPPCQAEIPGFVDLYKNYKDKGVEIIGVSVDEGGTDVVKSFVTEKGINYPVFHAGADVARKYRIRGIPDTHIYSPGGKLFKRHVGFTSKEEFEQQINELLK